jgi:Spy/CpxP family protein refolding chaperone
MVIGFAVLIILIVGRCSSAPEMSSVRRPLRRSCGATIAALFVATMTSLPAAFAEPMPPGNQQHSMPGMDSPQKVGLAQEIAELRSRIGQIQAALDQNRQGGSFKAGIQPGGMAGSASTTIPLDLPGFPGASHIYHIGATAFFLDSSAAIKLTAEQQAALKGIKEKSIGDMAGAQRQIDQAEQELWMLTASDRPDSMMLEMKVRDIERLKGDQRIAFIRSVGEAARVLTDDQRAALLSTGAPQAAQMTAPQGSAGSVNPQGGMGSTDPKAGMAGMGDDDSMGNLGGNAPDTKSNNGGMGDM